MSMEVFKRGIRKKKDTSSESTKPYLWQEDEKRVREATCSFQVKYHGCVEVFESRGIQVCEDAVNLLKNNKKRIQRAILYVSGDALRVVDELSKGLIVDQTIEKVSFCAPDRNNERGFAYICRDGTTRRWMCHVFMAVKESGERLSHAVGCAFTICLERKQLREKEKVSAAVLNSDANFRRTGSFRPATLVERLADPQSTIIAEPIPMKKSDNPFAIQRPRPSTDTIQRQTSLISQSSPAFSGHSYKRNLSLAPEHMGSLEGHEAPQSKPSDVGCLTRTYENISAIALSVARCDIGCSRGDVVRDEVSSEPVITTQPVSSVVTWNESGGGAKTFTTRPSNNSENGSPSIDQQHELRAEEENRVRSSVYRSVMSQVSPIRQSNPWAAELSHTTKQPPVKSDETMIHEELRITQQPHSTLHHEQQLNTTGGDQSAWSNEPVEPRRVVENFNTTAQHAFPFSTAVPHPHSEHASSIIPPPHPQQGARGSISIMSQQPEQGGRGSVREEPAPVHRQYTVSNHDNVDKFSVFTNPSVSRERFEHNTSDAESWLNSITANLASNILPPSQQLNFTTNCSSQFNQGVFNLNQQVGNSVSHQPGVFPENSCKVNSRTVFPQIESPVYQASLFHHKYQADSNTGSPVAAVNYAHTDNVCKETSVFGGGVGGTMNAISWFDRDVQNNVPVSAQWLHHEQSRASVCMQTRPDLSARSGISDVRSGTSISDVRPSVIDAVHNTNSTSTVRNTDPSSKPVGATCVFDQVPGQPGLAHMAASGAAARSAEQQLRGHMRADQLIRSAAETSALRHEEETGSADQYECYSNEGFRETSTPFSSEQSKTDTNPKLMHKFDHSTSSSNTPKSSDKSNRGSSIWNNAAFTGSLALSSVMTDHLFSAFSLSNNVTNGSTHLNAGDKNNDSLKGNIDGFGSAPWPVSSAQSSETSNWFSTIKVTSSSANKSNDESSSSKFFSASSLSWPSNGGSAWMSNTLQEVVSGKQADSTLRDKHASPFKPALSDEPSTGSTDFSNSFKPVEGSEALIDFKCKEKYTMSTTDSRFRLIDDAKLSDVPVEMKREGASESDPVSGSAVNKTVRSHAMGKLKMFAGITRTGEFSKLCNTSQSSNDSFDGLHAAQVADVVVSSEGRGKEDEGGVMVEGVGRDESVEECVSVDRMCVSESNVKSLLIDKHNQPIYENVPHTQHSSPLSEKFETLPSSFRYKKL